MEELIRNYIEHLKEAMNKSDDLTEIRKEEEFPISPYLQSIQDELENIVKLLSSKNTSTEERKSNAYKLLVHLHNAQSSASLLESFLLFAQSSSVWNKIRGKIQNAVNWVRNHLIPWLQNLWSSVWGIIQTLITPKEWKLSGELGTGVLGFAKASIEITFG